MGDAQRDQYMSFNNSDRVCFSPAEAAKALGIGRTTLFALLGRGDIKARKLGARTLIAASELDRYVASLPEARFHSHAGQEA